MRYRSIHHDNGLCHPTGATIIPTESGHIEIGIYDRGMPARFELLFCDQRGNVLPPPVGVTLEIERADGRREAFGFARFGNSLESTADVAGPFEFDVRLTVPREEGLVAHTFRFFRNAAVQDARQTPKAAAVGKCYAHHRFWAATFAAVAGKLSAGKRQARANLAWQHSQAQMKRYSGHLNRMNAALPEPRDGLHHRLVRWLVIHSRGIGLSVWAGLADAEERRLRRIVLRLHGVNSRDRLDLPY